MNQNDIATWYIVFTVHDSNVMNIKTTSPYSNHPYANSIHLHCIRMLWPSWRCESDSLTACTFVFEYTASECDSNHMFIPYSAPYTVTAVFEWHSHRPAEQYANVMCICECECHVHTRIRMAFRAAHSHHIHI